MRYFLFALILLFCLPFCNIAQVIEDGFEGNGTITTWYGDDCGMNSNFNNPYQQGINTSNTVLEYHDTGGQFANVRFDAGSNFDLTAKNTFSLKVYVPSSELTGNQNNQISLKLQDGTINEPWTTQSEIIKPITLNEWQTVTFDFEHDIYINLDGGSLPPIQRTDFNRVVIQVNGENNNDFVLAYIDDIDYYQYTPPAGSNPVFDNLVWSDEFDTNGALDNTKWFHQTQLPAGESWYNGEIQHYTDRTDNAVVSNGIMSIIAREETYTNQGVTKQHTSARLNSKFAFKYGRVEVRAKLPSGAGTWPAIWMLGKNIIESGAYWTNQGFGTVQWPACGEIDIMEHWGTNQNYVQSAMHTPSSFGATENHAGQVVPTASSEFHVYALEWTSEKMTFSVDGVNHYIYEPEVQNASTWPFDAEQYILLNVAILPSISPNFTQSSMDIDYVRIYQESPVATTELGNTENIVYYPNPITNELNIEVGKTTEQTVPVKIHHIDGKLIHSYNKTINDNKITLNNLEHLSSGMYIVSYIMDNKNYSLKVYKE